ncbi:ABC transporter substrate-binding protein [Bradyrhizobium daqingense]|nr:MULTISPECIES: ABC transporter substrate-binding protein [Bradyrhizobium]UFS88982.1 ABC transporter substrate-binding protein [Bradyrhizobium daqingense]
MSSVIAVGTLSSVDGPVSAQSSRELRVAFSGGNFGKAIAEAYVKPFQTETGVKVIQITQDIDAAQIATMVHASNITVDVLLMNQVSAFTLAAKGNLEKIDYSIYRQVELEATQHYCKQPFGFGSFVYSMNMIYNTGKFPGDKPRPSTWAEFWDVKKFPGARTLRTGQYGALGPFEEALLADGVPVDALYPMDIDRVFASLDKIKPHIRKWWSTGSEILQMMRDNVADVAQGYDGRAQALIDEGAPIEISRSQAKLAWDNWIIPKGSPNVQSAQKFIELTSRADRQAAFAQLFTLAPSNHSAYKQLPENVARKLATYPEYMASSFAINPKWYLESGPDGLSNMERLIQRWNEWSLR